MTQDLSFDLPTAHRYFSAACFNAAWDMIDKPDRTPAEDEQMLLRTFASFYHWTQRAECTAENRSIALWQISRVYILLKQPDNARRYAEQCRAESEDPNLPPFCLAYAYEALARSEMLAGDTAKMNAYLAEARAITERMSDLEAKEMVLKDLATIG